MPYTFPFFALGEPSWKAGPGVRPWKEPTTAWWWRWLCTMGTPQGSAAGQCRDTGRSTQALWLEPECRNQRLVPWQPSGGDAESSEEKASCFWMSSVNRDECQRRFCSSIAYGLYGGIAGRNQLGENYNRCKPPTKPFFFFLLEAKTS